MEPAKLKNGKRLTVCVKGTLGGLPNGTILDQTGFEFQLGWNVVSKRHNFTLMLTRNVKDAPFSYTIHCTS